MWNKVSSHKIPAIQSRIMGYRFHDGHFILHTNQKSRKAMNIEDNEVVEILSSVDQQYAERTMNAPQEIETVKDLDRDLLAVKMQFSLKDFRPVIQVRGIVKKLYPGDTGFAEAEEAYMSAHQRAGKYKNSSNVIFSITPIEATLQTTYAAMKL